MTMEGMHEGARREPRDEGSRKEESARCDRLMGIVQEVDALLHASPEGACLWPDEDPATYSDMLEDSYTAKDVERMRREYMEAFKENQEIVVRLILGARHEIDRGRSSSLEQYLQRRKEDAAKNFQYVATEKARPLSQKRRSRPSPLPDLQVSSPLEEKWQHLAIVSAIGIVEKIIALDAARVSSSQEKEA